MTVKVLYTVVIGIVAVLYYYELLFATYTTCVHLVVALLGIYLGASWILIRGQQYNPPPIQKEFLHPHIRMMLQNMMELPPLERKGPKKIIISRNMDSALQDIIDLMLRDFVLSWYRDLAFDHVSLLSYLESDLWMVIENVSHRLMKIDTVKFVTKDVVDALKIHFRDIRLASKKGAGSTEEPACKFVLHSWLHSEEEELSFLCKVSEALLLEVLPKHLSKSSPVRHLLCEVVANKILKPTIDLMCDPDYINLKLIAYIEYREKLSEDTRRTYRYAATYEDFVKMIDKYKDVEHLKQLRLNIMTEIMQATTINNLTKSRSTDKPDLPKGSKSSAKGELLKQRNLKRYINQLTVAKARCEKQIYRVSGADYKTNTEDTDDCKIVTSQVGYKILDFDVIMKSTTGREHFESFLQRDGNEALIGYWIAVEKLKNSDKRQHHHIASYIYQQYISSNTNVVKVDKAVAKSMETFLLGDSGPEAFFEVQKDVYKILEDRHYPSFVVSDLYHQFLTIDSNIGDADQVSGKDELLFEPKDEEDDEMFTTQSYHAKQKLQFIDSKILNKSQALEALRISGEPKVKLKSDPKILKAQNELESEVEAMKEEKKKLESHILRTEQWCENVGQWNAHIYGADNVMEGDKKVPRFVLVIHLSGATSQNLQSSSQGWVVTRKLQDFYTVHEKLAQIAGSLLKNKELPKIGRFTTIDDKFLNDSKKLLNEYLTTIMKDERLAQSEALYGFLTPTPEYFQQPIPEKKSEFFLKTFLKSFPSIGQDSRDTEDDLMFGQDERIDDRNKDSIAEPLYDLINEVYELKGMFKWLRKSFITFVEVTFGRSINRQLRETIFWIFSQPMIIYYLRILKDSMWPNGILAESAPERSVDVKLRTRLKAKEKFLIIQPDAVKTLVGEENARRGTIKMFEVLQDGRLNKQLIYVLLILLLRNIIPELDSMFTQEKQDEETSEVTTDSSEHMKSTEYIRNNFYLY